ncbi:galectin-3-binding protein B-like [Amphiura filiformis]|uniref:galectin-3-binding protein B-like n=1 Tax=Amphiura filiformis TaxID=82378 RepID=UPI003B2246CA
MDVFKMRNAVSLCIAFALISEVSSSPWWGENSHPGGRNRDGWRGNNGDETCQNSASELRTCICDAGYYGALCDQVLTESAVRLVGSMYSNSNEGRVEVYHNGEWGTVCDVNGDNFAMVVCRQLGFQSGGVAKADAYFGHGDDHIWIRDVLCSGSENRLDECQDDGWGSGDSGCEHYEDVGVICNIGDEYMSR